MPALPLRLKCTTIMAIKKEDLHPLGYFSKLHGYKGELTAAFQTVDQADYTDLESLYVESKGVIVPYFIESIEHKTNSSIKIKLEGIDTEAAARALVKCPIFIDKEQVSQGDEEQMELMSMEGYSVVDMTHGPIGAIERIEDNKLNPLMVIRYEDKEILLPLHPDFIEKMDHKKRIVHIAAPEGLIDFYLGEQDAADEEEE
jgi:16S rRNA processing protein RimM